MTTGTLLVTLALAMPQDLDTTPWLDLTDPHVAADWAPVHDVVMGGVSEGTPQPTEHGLQLRGRVSLDNNGGFASFRAPARRPELADADGLRLRVRGDARVWKLSLRTDGGWDGISWRASFEVQENNDWQVVDLAFEDFVPSWRGRLVSDAPPLEPGDVRQLGLLIADEQVGPFDLSLASVDTWRAASGFAADAVARSRELQETLDDDTTREASAVLDDLGWSERVLALASPAVLDAESSKQIGRFLARRSELDDRDLRVVWLMASTGRLAGRTLTAARARGLRDAWDLPRDTWQVALVGKDGGVKARWTDLVDPAEVFRRIDAMPMRARELADR